jgi:uncharacterized protein YndB with AHSA1/START domain
VTLPPIERSISVSWDQAEAFRRFAFDFAKWWPTRTHSIGGPRLRRVVLEPHVGGRIYEELDDGRRFQWGRILEWEPPGRLKFTFHPSREPENAQDVAVRFTPEGTGTRLTLVASNWENWGKDAEKARKGYYAGWGYVLNVWAGRRSVGMRAMEFLAWGMTALQWFKGGRPAIIARSKGEIAPESAPDNSSHPAAAAQR